MPTTNVRKRLSDFKFLFQKLEQEAKRLKLWKSPLTIQEANDIFDKVKSVIISPNKRRASQMKWLTAATHLRKHRNTAATEQNE